MKKPWQMRMVYLTESVAPMAMSTEMEMRKWMPQKMPRERGVWNEGETSSI